MFFSHRSFFKKSFKYFNFFFGFSLSTVVSSFLFCLLLSVIVLKLFKLIRSFWWAYVETCLPFCNNWGFTQFRYMMEQSTSFLKKKNNLSYWITVHLFSIYKAVFIFFYNLLLLYHHKVCPVSFSCFNDQYLIGTFFALDWVLSVNNVKKKANVIGLYTLIKYITYLIDVGKVHRKSELFLFTFMSARLYF